MPTPMAYQKLCKHLSDEWGQIKNHFSAKTMNQTHKVSRIHIRKMYNENKLFEMNYDDWRNNGAPENKLIYGMKYAVHADISKCFPKENGLHSTGFPLISAGIFGYPLDGAWRKAIQACNDFIQGNPDYDIKITFAVLDDKILL